METLIHILVFLFLLLGNIVLWPVLFLFGRNELRAWRRDEEDDKNELYHNDVHVEFNAGPLTKEQVQKILGDQFYDVSKNGL